MLQAYFDESQRDGGTLCVAGYLFSPTQARRLTKGFRKEFGQYGGFHMKELAHKRKLYSGITDAERDRLIKRAVEITSANARYAVSVFVNVNEYRAHAPRWQRGYKEPYSFLCYMAMTAMACLVRDNREQGPIVYVFEAGHAHEAEARDFVKAVSVNSVTNEYYLYGGDAFLPKSDAVPLQAADLLAWEMAKFKDETLDDQIRPMRASMRGLFAPDSRRYRLFPLEGEPLVRGLKGYEAIASDKKVGNDVWKLMVDPAEPTLTLEDLIKL